MTAPSLISAEVLTDGHGAVLLDLRLSWRWTLRRPKEIRFGVRIADHANDATLEDLQPAHGVMLPSFPSNQLRLIFSADPGPDEVPRVVPPESATVAIVPPPEPDQAGGPDPFDRSDFVDRTYRLTVRLGAVPTLFASAERRTIAVVADALEVVSGLRRSGPSRKIFAGALDPRPPQIANQPWSLLWASRPDGANESRVFLAPPRMAAGSLATFTVWRSHESSVFDRILASRPELSHRVDIIRGEDTMDVRLALLKRLVDHVDATTPAFRTELIKLFAAAIGHRPAGQGVELSLPGTQTGLELFLFMATSKTGVDSDKTLLAEAKIRVVARDPLDRRAEIMLGWS